MGTVINGNFKRFLADYSSQEPSAVSDNAGFAVGVLLTIVAPIVSYCSYGGPVRPVMFIGVMLTGSLIGVARYRLSAMGAGVQLRIGSLPEARSRINIRTAA